MALDQETINQELALLAAHRRTLAALLQQQALLGGAAYTSPGVVNGIEEARIGINRIKAIFRENGVPVEDEPNDEAPLQTEPVQLQRMGGEILSGDKVAGDKIGGNKVLGDQRNINTGGGDYAEGNIDKRQGEVFVEDSVVFGDVVGQKTIHYYQPAVTPLDRQQQRNRRAMLQKVKTIWIEGLLEQSLAKELRIALDLTERPDAVDLPLNALVQELEHPPQQLRPGTPIIEVFDKMGGELLILGAPGAGKTTLLLELARDLIARAERDEAHPIPVIFNLSSWSTKQRPLKEWMVEELNTKYYVPRKLAEAWMNADVVLPLLDGLDEVAADPRGACVEAINVYRQEHGLVPLAVCSRLADFEALTAKLRLQGAIVVQPLTEQQIDAYLERAGEQLTGVRAALRDDAALGEMLDTPLMLNIVTLAYPGKAAGQLAVRGTLGERRYRLFAGYIDRMFHRRGATARYTSQQTLGWLSWLAGQMVKHNEAVFYIDWMQPNWLRQRQQQWYAFRISLLCGLLVGLLAGLLIGASLLGFALLDGVTEGFALGVSLVLGVLVGIGLLVGLFDGLVCVLRGGADVGHITIYERLQWSWPKLRSAIVRGMVGSLRWWLPVGLAFGLALGLVGLAEGPHLGLLILAFVLGSALVYGLVSGTIGGLINGWTEALSGVEIKVRAQPNEGIRLSARNLLYGVIYQVLPFWMLGGVVFGLTGAVLGGIGIIQWQGGAVSGGLAGIGIGLLVGSMVGGMWVGVEGGGLNYGGRAVIQHYTLRWLLYRNGLLPLRLVPFLDYCVDRIFLRRVGGGYIFVHRLLMEHFASLQDAQR